MTLPFSTLILPLLALGLVLALVPLLKRWAIRSGHVDAPGGRKRHEEAVPPIGGLAVFPVFAGLAALAAPSAGFLWFVAALALLVVTGALDDRYTVPARIRFPIQFLAAFLMVVPGGFKTVTLGNLFGWGELWLGIGAIPFSIIATVLLINAINLMDGLDGLSGGIAFQVVAWLVLFAITGGREDMLPSLLIMGGALAGFLFYNMRHPWRARASVFIGDAGSLALGLTLAWFAFTLSQDLYDVRPLKTTIWSSALPPITVAWLLAIPIYDTCGQFARRVSQGRHPFDADHHHFHHHFIYAGFTPGQATAGILFIAFLLSCIGAGGALLGMPDYILAYLWTALLLAHIYMSMRPTRYRRLLARLRNRKPESE